MSASAQPSGAAAQPNPETVGGQQIEADQIDNDDAQSEYSDSQSFTTSIKSSITNYRYENGRRYHAFKDGSYYLPNDESELDRLDLFHHCIILRLNDKLHLAPIGPNPKRILDLGTGTGLWAIEMGDMYPSAEVLGNDLSPVQPTMVPPNVTFEVDDVEGQWVYRAPFDFIHVRAMAGALKDWPKLMRQSFEFTKPGGWVEFQDFDMRFYTNNGEFVEGCPLDIWAKECISGITSVGLEAEPGPKLEKWVKDAGFINVEQKVLPIPLGTWAKDKRLKEVGACDQSQFVDGLEGISLRIFTQMRGWAAEEVAVFLEKVRADMNNPKLRAQHNLYVVYAQKPSE